MIKGLAMVLGVLVSCYTVAQDFQQVRPGKLYAGGSAVESPRYGFKAVIPDGYAGMLPQGTELFMLSKQDGTSGEVLVFARPDGDLETLKSNWKEGGALTESIYLRAAGEIGGEGDLAYAEVMAEGERINPQYKAFIIGRCGPYGPCVTLLMITQEQFFEEVRNEMLAFMRGGEFTEPSSRNPYEDFNWQEFLSGKVLVTYEMEQGAKRQNLIHLCADGTFRSNIRQTGWLKQENKAYVGKNRGSWSVEGSGSETLLSLTFEKEKIPPLQVLLSIQDEKIFAFGERYYAGYSDQCE